MTNCQMFEKFVNKAREKKVAIRIGVNSGSIEKKILKKNNRDPVSSIVESTLENVRFLESLKFFNFKISAKASSVMETITIYEILSNKIDYPLHLGVTEAGPLFKGSIKSAVGLGILLSKGIGDTIRVSLTDSSTSEVKAAYAILNSLNLRKFGVNLISCPTCGRTKVNLKDFVTKIETSTANIKENIKIAIMGCIVNGPGEAKDADIGIAFGKEKAAIFIKGKIVKRVNKEKALDEFLKEILKLKILYGRLPVRYSEFFINTLKEEPSDSEIESYSLCLRSGLIRKIASGIYAFMPIGFNVLKKIEDIVRQEMNRTGAIEMLMPAMQPADLWIKSERWFEYGPEMFRLKDRSERDFCLGPTHEELITYLAFLDIKSYKELPVNLYQIQVKFRDEIRPRYGILRAREFIMKDAYSFSANEEDMDTIYNKMYECYSRILERLNLKYFAVQADTGLIGGKYSHEFIILSSNGEDQLVYCPSCGFSANYEMAGFARADEKSQDSSVEVKLSEVFTPGTTNIKSLSEFLKVPADMIIKTMLLKDSQGTVIAVLLRGDKELNLAKCEKFIGKKLELLSDSDPAVNLSYWISGSG